MGTTPSITVLGTGAPSEAEPEEVWGCGGGPTGCHLCCGLQSTEFEQLLHGRSSVNTCSVNKTPHRHEALCFLPLCHLPVNATQLLRKPAERLKDTHESLKIKGLVSSPYRRNVCRDSIFCFEPLEEARDPHTETSVPPVTH